MSATNSTADPIRLIIHPWSEEAQAHLSAGVQVLELDELRGIVIALEEFALRQAEARKHESARFWIRTASKFRCIVEGRVWSEPFPPTDPAKGAA